MAGVVWLKQGVIGAVCREIRLIIGTLTKLYADAGLDLYITSIREGTHSPGSLHYDGKAIDFRKGPITFAKIKEALPKGFDLVEEGDHFHLEWDPK